MRDLCMVGIFLPLTGLPDYSGYRISRFFVHNEPAALDSGSSQNSRL